MLLLVDRAGVRALCPGAQPCGAATHEVAYSRGLETGTAAIHSGRRLRAAHILQELIHRPQSMMRMLLEAIRAGTSLGPPPFSPGVNPWTHKLLTLWFWRLKSLNNAILINERGAAARRRTFWESDVAILVCRFIDERGKQSHTWAAEDLQRRDQGARKAKGRGTGNPGRSRSNRNMFQQMDEPRFPPLCN